MSVPTVVPQIQLPSNSKACVQISRKELTSRVVILALLEVKVCKNIFGQDANSSTARVQRNMTPSRGANSPGSSGQSKYLVRHV